MSLAGPQLQRKLILDDPPPLVLADIATARHQLPGHTEDDILELIETGDLLYAWDISSSFPSLPSVKNSDRPARREIRIYPDCIAHYKATAGLRPYHVTEADVLKSLFTRAQPKPFIKSSTLRLILNCSATHIINLIEANDGRPGSGLAVLPHTTWGTGPNGAALVTVASVESFLRNRRQP